jgi:hypothetical protein
VTARIAGECEDVSKSWGGAGQTAVSNGILGQIYPLLTVPAASSQFGVPIFSSSTAMAYMTVNSKSGKTLGPVAFSGVNSAAFGVGAAIAGGTTWVLLKYVHPALAILMFVLLLVFPFHIWSETHPRRWSLLAGAVVGSLTALLRPLDSLQTDLVPNDVRDRLVIGVGLFLPALVSTFIAGQMVDNPHYPPLRETIKDWSASVGFWVALVTMCVFFATGLDPARTVGGQLTTAFVSLGIVVMLGYRAGIWLADFVLERKTTPTATQPTPASAHSKPAGAELPIVR